MEKRILGKDLVVSAVGLGCMGFSHAYGVATNQNEAIKTIREAYELGYLFFDTAQCYQGYYQDGNVSINEELVGKALIDVRPNATIATKFGVNLEHQTSGKPIPDSRPEVIYKSVDESLKKLKTDYIDLYFQHRIDPKVPAEVVAEVMADLIKKGKIRHWGISETDESYLRKAHAVCPVTAVENRYSMMARNYEHLFPVLEELKVGLVAFSPMANGFLSGAYSEKSNFEDIDYRSIMPQFSHKGIAENQMLLKYIFSIAHEYNASPAQISLAWMLCKRSWIVPIPGSRKLARIKENASSTEIKLNEEEVSKIDSMLDTIKMSDIFGVEKSN